MYNHTPDSDSIFTWVLPGDLVTMGIGVPLDENFGGGQQQNFPENLFLYGDGIHFSREGHQIIGKTAME